jgi:hypothetical protein
MSRSIRLEFEGALYLVTSRGDRREDIYVRKRGQVHFPRFTFLLTFQRKGCIRNCSWPLFERDQRLLGAAEGLDDALTGQWWLGKG